MSTELLAASTDAALQRYEHLYIDEQADEAYRSFDNQAGGKGVFLF
jgi:hypothetical protein